MNNQEDLNNMSGNFNKNLISTPLKFNQNVRYFILFFFILTIFLKEINNNVINLDK
jgi:hypothetical protein